VEYEVEGSRPRGRPNRTWRKVVQKDHQAPGCPGQRVVVVVVVVVMA